MQNYFLWWCQFNFGQIVIKQLINKQIWKVFFISPNRYFLLGIYYLADKGIKVLIINFYCFKIIFLWTEVNSLYYFTKLPHFQFNWKIKNIFYRKYIEMPDKQRKCNQVNSSTIDPSVVCELWTLTFFWIGSILARFYF